MALSMQKFCMLLHCHPSRCIFFEASFPFMDFIHLYGAEPGMEALVHFKTEHINVDAVSPRRIQGYYII